MFEESFPCSSVAVQKNDNSGFDFEMELDSEEEVIGEK